MRLWRRAFVRQGCGTLSVRGSTLKSFTTNKDPELAKMPSRGLVFDIRNSCEIIEYETVGDPSKDELRGFPLCKEGMNERGI